MVSSSSQGRWLSRALKGLLLLGASAVALGACGGDDATCDGVEIHGGCETKCDPKACVDPATMKCVDNGCSQPCVAQTDCPEGKACFGATASDGTVGQFCVLPPGWKKGQTGRYESCTANDQCDTYHGYECLTGICKKVNCTTNAECAGIGKCIMTATPSYCEQGVTPLAPFEACTATSDCDTDVGLSCVNGQCRFAGCTTHGDCAGIGPCSEGTDDTGQTVLACAEGTTYPKGQFGSACPGDKIAQGCTSDTGCPDGQGCHPTIKRCMPRCGELGACPSFAPVCEVSSNLCTECDLASGFTCIGSGPGDSDAYCSKTGCAADADCGLGYTCQALRTSKLPCAATCGFAAGPANNCVKATDIGDGKEYSCGPVSLLRHMCVKREFCASCETDDDCRANPNQVCAADASGAKICTQLCDPAVANACPWGNAGKCEVTDTAKGVATCSHRFDKCVGTGGSCEPCVDDLDCPDGLCIQSEFTNERFCLDLAGASCDCTGLPTSNGTCTGGGCPQTPGGLNMQCFGTPEVQAQGSILYQECYGANVNLNPNVSPQTGCWGPQ
jgi:hypothetical protein